MRLLCIKQAIISAYKHKILHICVDFSSSINKTSTFQCRQLKSIKYYYPTVLSIEMGVQICIRIRLRAPEFQIERSKHVLLIFIKTCEISVEAVSRRPEGPDGIGNNLKPIGYIEFSHPDDRE